MSFFKKFIRDINSKSSSELFSVYHHCWLNSSNDASKFINSFKNNGSELDEKLNKGFIELLLKVPENIALDEPPWLLSFIRKIKYRTAILERAKKTPELLQALLHHTKKTHELIAEIKCSNLWNKDKDNLYKFRKSLLALETQQKIEKLVKERSKCNIL